MDFILVYNAKQMEVKNLHKREASFSFLEKYIKTNSPTKFNNHLHRLRYTTDSCSSKIVQKIRGLLLSGLEKMVSVYHFCLFTN
jgi:hypothetical protein